MYILGINPGHNATACLLKDGKIIACVSEERFSRLKNHMGFPYEAIKYVLSFAGIKSKELDLIVFSTISNLKTPGRIYDTFMESYTNKGLMKKLFGYLAYHFPLIIDPLIKLHYPRYIKSLEDKKIKNSEKIADLFEVLPDKIIHINHHLAHAMSACFNLSKNEKTLIFTLDGEGDFLCATVNIFDGKRSNFKKISETDKGPSLGYLYALATLHLGMKPNQHEFKVMGLAPYAKKEKVEEVYNKLKEILWIEDLKFKSQFRMQYSDYYLSEKMRFVRFDNLAGAIQKLTEELTLNWILNAIKKTKINNIALSGGVFMNVKVNQRISELSEVKEIFCVPSAGDESTAIGACFYGYKKYCKENNIKFDPKPIEDLYLGPEYNNEYIENLIKSKNLKNKYKITYFKDINHEIAILLAKGKIVARCTGRSEWGARALGNRGILANPVHSDTIRVLNETIKDRDFWMPFTPSIIDEDMKKYSLNPKKIRAPYMAITFNSTEKAKKELPAAMHPYDFTIRPQSVYKNWNPEYYNIISEFKKLTGTGAVLNTSFNLHGEPNVLTPEDALHTLENSGLNYLAMGNYLFEKRVD